jgi:hypothetical protein
LRRHLLVLPLPALRVGFDVPLPKRCRTGQISYSTAQRPRGVRRSSTPTLAHEVSRNESKIAATGSAPHGGGHSETTGSAGARQRCSPGALMWQQVEVAVGRAITTTTVCLLRFHLQRETLLYLFQVQTIQTHLGSTLVRLKPGHANTRVLWLHRTRASCGHCSPCRRLKLLRESVRLVPAVDDAGSCERRWQPAKYFVE